MNVDSLVGEVGLRLLRRVNRGETITPERAVTEMLNVFDAPFLGPQPKRECCPSCQIIARAVARLAYAIGYEETGDELADLLAAMGGEG